jgi:STE24 endopeptidase
VCALVLSAGGATAAVAAPRAEHPKARLGDYFVPADVERSRRYRGPVYLFAFGAIAASLVAGGALGLGPGLRAIGRWSASATGGRWALQALLLAAIVTIVIAIAQLPFSIGSYFHDRHWGLVTQGFGGFLADTVKGTGFQLALAAITAVGFIGIVRALPRAWPAVAAAFAVVLTVILVYVFPVIYEPLFNRFTPVEPSVRARIVAIAERAGVKVGDVLVADASRRTTRLNAYVSGLGATKRVVLYDTLLERATPREVDLVVAHELGHVAHRDVVKGTAIAAAGAAAAVLLIWRLLAGGGVLSWIGAGGPGDPRVLPFLAFVLAAASLLTLPAQNWYSRGIEAAADRAAIDYTHDPVTAIKVEAGLARSNIADLTPNGFVRWAFFSHPPTLDRIQVALDWEADHPGRAVPAPAADASP